MLKLKTTSDLVSKGWFFDIGSLEFKMIDEKISDAADLELDRVRPQVQGILQKWNGDRAGLIADVQKLIEAFQEITTLQKGGLH